jgi:hypothetical protein
MLSVHKLPLTHEILAGHEEAKAARDTGVCEALVIIDRGLVVSVRFPPCGMDEFGSDEDWIFSAIRDGYARGLGVLDGETQVAPDGWTLWRDLTPGTVATSGNPDEDAPVLVVGGDGCFRSGSRTFNAARLQRGDEPHTFRFNPAAPPIWPFFRVLRAGLNGEQIHHLAAAVESGEDIEEALARLAPLAARCAGARASGSAATGIRWMLAVDHEEDLAVLLDLGDDPEDMSMPPLKLDHIQTMQVGEEDGAPVCIAAVRCILASRASAISDPAPVPPPEAILWWDEESESDTVDDETVIVRVIAVPVGVEPPGWAWHDPEMGAVAHDITWHSGHVSSSATVCDLYLADASLLLTVITPAHQQAHNLAEIGTAAYAPGDRSP